MNLKFLSLLFTCLIGIAVAFTACNDEPDPDPDPIVPALTAAIASPLSLDTVYFAATTITASEAGTLLNISGAAASRSMTISFTNDGTVGTRNIALTGPAFATYTDNTSVYQSNSGTVTITEWDTTAKTITGTFSFNAQLPTGAGKNVENGAFVVGY